MDIKLTFSRKTSKNFYKRFYAEDGLNAWYVFTNKGRINRVIERSYSSSIKETFIENDIDVKELPIPILDYIRKAI